MNERKLVKRLNNVPRRWFFMPTLDWYIFREFMVYFSILLLVFGILFFLSNVFNDLSLYQEKRTPWNHIAYFFLLKLPGNIRFVLPISVLLGCMWTMAMFGKHMEVTAMRASGVSLFRCGGPIFAVGLVVTAVNIYFNEQLVPYTEREAEVLKEVWTKTGGEAPAFQTMLTYRSPNPDDPRTWFFRTFELAGSHHMVMVKDFRPDGTLDWDLVAKSADYEPGVGWKFHDVTLTPYTLDGLMAKVAERYEEYTLPPSEAPETPDDILNSIKDEDELPTWVIYYMLRKTPNMPEQRRVMYETVFYYRLAFPWACFLAVFLGIPLATKNERSGIMLSIVTAVAIIVVYIATSQAFLVLGKGGAMNPVVAGLLPTLVFIAYGWFRVLRDRA